MMLTPFQFSSNRLQYNTASPSFMKFMRPSGNTSNTGLVGDTLQTMMAWYEMWVNPQSVKVRQEYRQVVQHTAGAIVTFHYRKDLLVIQVSGYVGWIQIQSMIEELQSQLFSALRDPRKIGSTMWSGVKQVGKTAKTIGKAGTFTGGASPADLGSPLKAAAGALGSLGKLALSETLGVNNRQIGSGRISRINNSPRKFLERLRNLADEPAYYLDEEGCEHYNIKYLKMFTKQHPQGIIYEGWFRYFEIPETADDAQTIQYSFEFVAENQKPVTLLQRVAGMFSGLGTVAGDITGLF